jgi:uncharacterized protein (DUF1800 family)
MRPGEVRNQRTFAGANLRAKLLAALLVPLLAIPLGLAAGGGTVSGAVAHAQERSQRTEKMRLPIDALSETEAILHALNRLGFGPRPGDVERVRAIGLEKWVERQLNPDSIDDAALTARLERFSTLAMSSSQLLQEFPNPAEAARQMGLSPEEYRKQMEDRARSGAVRPEEIRLPQRIIAELQMAKLTRAVYSERQLAEVMTDFWFNHFNVFAPKGADRWLITSYERDVIRPHAIGKFHDLLVATAKSPAMLFYLDNWMSADPEAAARLEREFNQRRQRLQRFLGNRPGQYPPPALAGRVGPQQPGKQPQPPQMMRRGLNENYARELLELHTLGVDGGYTQLDVIEVARCLTGWTMQAPRRSPEFVFDARFHDRKSKTVLGKKIDGGGIKEGEAVLEMLARHPSTARFISNKLARRFVADNPSPALVDRMAKTFLETDGDIRAVLSAMIYSPEFWARDAYRAKIKRPFELVASAARALGADVQVPLPLVQWVARIGEPLYQCQPPTGYSDTADAWVNTGALLNRLNFSLALATNRMRGVRVQTPSLLGAWDGSDHAAMLSRAADVFLAGQLSKESRATLEKQVTNPELLRASLNDPVGRVDAGVIAGLVLGTPEFQRR